MILGPLSRRTKHKPAKIVCARGSCYFMAKLSCGYTKFLLPFVAFQAHFGINSPPDTPARAVNGVRATLSGHRRQSSDTNSIVAGTKAEVRN